MALPNKLLLVLLVAKLALSVHAWIALQDVSISAGLKYFFGAKTKYGGPSIADVDGDGHQDMFFIHHDSYFIEVYFSKGDGTFSRETLTWRDSHAISPFRYSPKDRAMHFSLSQGGSNGKNPKPMNMFKVSTDKTIANVSLQFGITTNTRGRGRSALYLPLRLSITKSTPDVLVLNGPNRNFELNHQKGLAAVNGKFLDRNLRGFATERNWYAALTDVDGDGRMDVLSYHDLRLYKITGYFQLQDITASAFPPGMEMRGTVAIAELDFDNDGQWDLYVCRTRTGDLKWLSNTVQYTDYLLRNVGGRYVDVSQSAGLLQDGMSRGVTVGDFDNDGLIDLLVVKWQGPSVFLRNLGNDKFSIEHDVPARLEGAPGDMAQAVDYDRNGALDIVMSEGHTHDKSNGGFFRLFKNNLSAVASQNNYILVRVGSSPSESVSSQHAVATVFAGDIKMMRRVGPAGVAVSPSYIELLHFGLGKRTVDKVEVSWRDGSSLTIDKVETNSILTVGTRIG